MVTALLVELLAVVHKLLLLDAELDNDMAEVDEVEFCRIEWKLFVSIIDLVKLALNRYRSAGSDGPE